MLCCFDWRLDWRLGVVLLLCWSHTEDGHANGSRRRLFVSGGRLARRIATLYHTALGSCLISRWRGENWLIGQWFVSDVASAGVEFPLFKQGRDSRQSSPGLQSSTHGNAGTDEAHTPSYSLAVA